MNTLVSILCLLGVALDGVAAAVDVSYQPGAAPPGTHGVPGTPPVLDTKDIESLISREEREQRGVVAPSWKSSHGKVHPDVNAVLATGQMPWIRFRGWEPIGFERTAYVDVYLQLEVAAEPGTAEYKAALQTVQQRVLSRLTAAEFSATHRFTAHPAVAGFVTQAGLQKLALDSEVVAVGLDDMPVPEDSPYVAADPKQKSPPDAPLQKIDTQVQNALTNSPSGYVYVEVRVNQSALPPEGASATAWRDREAVQREAQERVLAALSADEFMLRTRGRILAGFINDAGLRKLADDANVAAVGLPVIGTVTGTLKNP